MRCKINDKQNKNNNRSSLTTIATIILLSGTTTSLTLDCNSKRATIPGDDDISNSFIITAENVDGGAGTAAARTVLTQAVVDGHTLARINTLNLYAKEKSERKTTQKKDRKKEGHKPTTLNT